MRQFIRRIERLEQQLQTSTLDDSDLDLGRKLEVNLSMEELLRFWGALDRRYGFTLEDRVGASRHSATCDCRYCAAWKHHCGLIAVGPDTYRRAPGACACGKPDDICGPAVCELRRLRLAEMPPSVRSA